MNLLSLSPFNPAMSKKFFLGILTQAFSSSRSRCLARRGASESLPPLVFTHSSTSESLKRSNRPTL